MSVCLGVSSPTLASPLPPHPTSVRICSTPETPHTLSSTPSWLMAPPRSFQSNRITEFKLNRPLCFKIQGTLYKGTSQWKTTCEDLQNPNIGNPPMRPHDSTMGGSDVINTHFVTTRKTHRLTTNTGNGSNARQFLPTLTGLDDGSPPTHRNRCSWISKNNTQLKNIHTGYSEITQKQAKLCC